MNIEMAYLLGMICGNGKIQRNDSETKISIFIPLLSPDVLITQSQKNTTMSFTKSNQDYNYKIVKKLNFKK